MIWLLAQIDEVNHEEALAKGWWNLSFILLVGTIAVLFLIAMILLRRWKHKQLAAIEQDRQARRAGKTGERLDAWSASAQRYVDHDKLSPDDELFEREDDEDDSYPDDDAPPPPEEDDRDPFGLFSDKPFQEADDDDDFDEDDEDDDGDWDDEDEDDKR